MEKQGLFKKCLSNKSVPTWPTLDTLEEIKWTSSKCQTIGIIWNRKFVGEKSRRSTNPLCLDAILKGLSTTSSSRAVMGPRIYQSHKTMNCCWCLWVWGPTNWPFHLLIAGLNTPWSFLIHPKGCCTQVQLTVNAPPSRYKMGPTRLANATFNFEWCRLFA